jgi:hypothetical protein
MQQVRFKNLEEFMAFLPEEELSLVLHLRNIVLDCIPACQETLAYNVPYYKKNRNICFIWPASVTWGKNKTYEGVRFGFTSGYLLKDELDYLDKGDRKQVFWKDFISPSDIDEDLLKSYIYEAVEIDAIKGKK